MSSGVWFMLGLGAGVLCTLVAVRWRVRRSRAKQQVAEERARSAERLAEVGAMTGGLAHEIKNPLSTIGLNAQLLAEAVEELPGDEPVGPEVKQRLVRRLASLRRETERLRGILSDFLAYAGELRLDAKDNDLNAMAQELVDFFQPQAQSQGVRLRTDLAPGPLRATFDAALMKQAVLNLLLNAVQAMPAGPDAAPDSGRPREVILRTRASEQGVELHVIDTGPGIPPQVLEQMFRPYFTTKSGGSGLGLPTTRRIIEAHGGRLDVHTSEGNGTDFVVGLPAT